MSLIARNFIRAALESADAVAPNPLSLAVAKLFHAEYEGNASAHGYETQEATRTFDPESSNGKLMTAVIQNLVDKGIITINESNVTATQEPAVEPTPEPAAPEVPETPAEGETPPVADVAPVDPPASEAPPPETSEEVVVNPPEAPPADPAQVETDIDNAASQVDSAADAVQNADTSTEPVAEPSAPEATDPPAPDVAPEEPAAPTPAEPETPPAEPVVEPPADADPSATDTPDVASPGEPVVPEAPVEPTPEPAATEAPVEGEAPPVVDSVPEGDVTPSEPTPEAPAEPAADATPPVVEGGDATPEAPGDGTLNADPGSTPTDPVVEGTGGDTSPAEPAAEATPDPVQDANTEVTAVQEIADLAAKAEEASNANEVVNEFNSVKDGMVDAYETAQAVNDAGGFTVESFASMQKCFSHLTRVMGIRTPVSFGDVTVESFAEGERKTVSLEHVAAIVDAIKAGAPDLEKKALDALSALSDSLTVALPSARNRLGAVVNAACQAQSDGAGKVAVDGNLKRLLGVNGAIPTDFTMYMKDYVKLGQVLLKEFAPASLATASIAPTLAEAFVGDTAEELHKKVIAKVDEIGDPRSTLSSNQLEMTLPGDVKLFETIPYGDASNEAQAKLVIYCSNFVPTDPGEFMEMVAEGGEGESQDSFEPLTREQIKAIAAELNTVYDILDIPTFNETRKGVFTSMISTALSLNDRMENGPQHLLEEFSTLQKAAQCYLSTVYSLSVWPAYHYLLNLIYTTNAFIVLAQRSLIAQETPEEPATPTPEVPAEPETPPAEPVVEPTPEPAADANASDPANANKEE